MLSLVFAAGQRPDADALEALADAVRLGGGDAPVGFQVSHRPPDDEGWAELLAQGLTFDCLELSPRRATAHAAPGQLLGLNAPPPGELVLLQPAPHLADGAGLLPVVRVLAGLGAVLSTLPGALAVCWGPAATCMEPGYFRRIVADWLNGGAFPALGLTMLDRGADGAMTSRGLALLIGQELRFEPDPAMSPQQAGQVAMRLVHLLVQHGPLDQPEYLTGPNGEALQAVPDDNGRVLRVRPCD